MPVYQLSDKSIAFPHPGLAEPDGLLAVGGDLMPRRLLTAYSNGIFPWFMREGTIYWFSPDPRFVLFPDELKIAKSMRPYFNQKKFTVSCDRDFHAVIRGCQNRGGKAGEGSWISDEYVEGYSELHRLGYAHSVEVWKDGELVGGLYGISLGRCFFGESMFARESNASKFGFISLVKKLAPLGFRLIDCQQQTGHLGSMGARSIPRFEFLEILAENAQEETMVGNWGGLFSS